MKKHISLLLGIILLFGSSTLGVIIFPDFECYISLGGIVVGGILISYAIYCIFSECSQSKKEEIEKLMVYVQKESELHIEQLKKIEIACVSLIEGQSKADEVNQESLKSIERICQNLTKLQEESVVSCIDKINEVINASDNLAKVEKNASEMQLKKLTALQNNCEEILKLQKEAEPIWEGRFSEINQHFQHVMQVCEEIENIQKDDQLNQLIAIQNNCEETLKLQKEAEPIWEDRFSEINQHFQNVTQVCEEIENIQKDDQLKQLIAIQKNCEEALKLQKEVEPIWKGRFNEINQYLQYVIETCEEMEDAQKNALVEEGKILTRLSEDIQSENKRLISKIVSSLSDMEEILEHCEQDNSENLQKLADEYQQFQNIAEGIIKNMTLMSEQDYEVLKGLLDE